MRYLNLRKLLEGQALITRIALFKNKAFYEILTLLDSRANGYYFINYFLLKFLSYFLKPLIYLLPLVIPVKRYNNKASYTISYYITLNLIINK